MQVNSGNGLVICANRGKNHNGAVTTAGSVYPMGALTFYAPKDGTYLLTPISVNRTSTADTRPVYVSIIKGDTKVIWPTNKGGAPWELTNTDSKVTPTIQIALKQGEKIRVVVHADKSSTNADRWLKLTPNAAIDSSGKVGICYAGPYNQSWAR